jgi:hypothetical protein
MDDPLEEARLAAKRLATTEEAVASYRMMDELLSKVPRVPAKLYGEAHSWINPLIMLLKSDPQAYEAVIQWCNKKRTDKGYTPLFSETPSFDKNPYQADLMVVIRERLRKAVDIENSRRPGRDALKGLPRKQFEKEITKKWSDGRNAMLLAERERKGSRLTKVEQQALLKAYWDGIDRQLDEAERGIR